MKLNKIEKKELKVYDYTEISITETTVPKRSGTFGEIILGTINLGNIPIVLKRYKNWRPWKTFTTDMCKELIILQFLNQYPETNSVKLYGILYDQPKNNCYLVLERLKADLSYAGIYLYGKKNYISALQYKTIFYKLLKSVNAIHSLGFIHTDLKLSNIMINDSDIKIIDFGSAKFIGLSPLKNQVNTYSTTKIIKAPDTRISFSTDAYSIAVSMIHLSIKGYAEIYNDSKTIYMKQRNEFFDIETKLKHITLFGDLGVDLLKKLTERDSNVRLCVNQALMHPYFKDFTDMPLKDILNGGDMIALENHTDDYTLKIYNEKKLELCYYQQMFSNYKDILCPIKKIRDDQLVYYYYNISWLLYPLFYNEDYITLLEGVDAVINVIVRVNNQWEENADEIIALKTAGSISTKRLKTYINMLIYNSITSTNDISQYKKIIFDPKNVHELDIIEHFYDYLQNINFEYYSVSILITYIYLEMKHTYEKKDRKLTINLNFFKDICKHVIFCFIYKPEIDISIWDIVIFSTIYILSSILDEKANDLIENPIIPILTIDYEKYKILFNFYHEQTMIKKMNDNFYFFSFFDISFDSKYL
jgi:serine/threonine protein kinase